jgi:hypothetical protein
MSRQRSFAGAHPQILILLRDLRTAVRELSEEIAALRAEWQPAPKLRAATLARVSNVICLPGVTLPPSGRRRKKR